MTTNYILDTNYLYDSKITIKCSEKEEKIDIIPIEHFCFSDPFIDITFIELKNTEYDGFDFVKIEGNDNGSTNVYIINDLKKMQIIKGKIEDKYGFKIYHDISLDDDYFGSALVSLDDNKVVGIYSNKKANNDKKYNVAISMKSANEAIKILYNSYLNNKIAFIQKENGYIQKKLKILTNTELNELTVHGLIASLNPEIFISPQSDYVTTLWFYRTNYAWYWTPTYPKDNNIENSNWIIICPSRSLIVIGSEWNGCEPAERNIDLIHWLESTGFDFLI
jgi:hypothetical protein